jgi:hypothetical protein
MALELKRRSIYPIALFTISWVLNKRLPSVAAIVHFAAILSLFYAIPWKQFIKLSQMRPNELKKDVMKQLVAFLSPQLNYKASGPFPDNEFYNSGLFEHRADINTVEDVIYGHYNDTEFTCCEISTADIKKTRDSNGKVTTRHVQRFRGLFFIIRFAKTFHGHTTVKTDRAEKSFGFLGRGLQRLKGRDSLVELEDPEFESQFVVRSTDQVEARFLLSSNFMKRVIDLRAKVNSDLQMAFHQSQLVIAIPHQKNLFEIFLSKPEQWEEQALELYDEINLILDILWDLQSNNQLWQTTRAQSS